MPRGSSPKRERQYEHIKKSAQERGESTERAKEIAARTVNKQRARSGESKTYDQLYEEAKRRNVEGRSRMDKSGLRRALGGEG
ncbi:plasmid stabilization protein [Streptomyces cinnabarinus]|uniref:Plasmid stabilization protein n=1 Tax=Streptomyces cinnabarinus TaxID=67287 RepID=A0ABY7KRL8_9ACTN|nr:plasmid stabilization protein [Streptomyces cinnabarinus]WAZ25346.1 plasmid stabilization protein [Streptomyces cinnabarinus]